MSDTPPRQDGSLSLPIWKQALRHFQAKGTRNERDLATFALGLLDIAASTPEGIEFLARRAQESMNDDTR